MPAPSDVATQRQRVLAALRSGRRLTALGALQSYGVARLAARIFDLRREGWDIVSRSVVVHKASGGEATIAEYYLRTGLRAKGGAPDADVLDFG